MPDLLDHTTSLCILDNAPFWIYIQQGERITWINRQLAQAMQIPESDSGYDAMAIAERLSPMQDPSPTLFITTPLGTPLWLRRDRIAKEDGSEIHYLRIINEEISLAEDKRELEDKLAALDVRDAVTGLANRRATLQYLDGQITRSRRYSNPLSILRLTLDFPENIDPLEASSVTRSIAQCLKDKLRWADKIGILEEHMFLIILPETTLCAAKELAGKLANDRATFPSKEQTCRFRFGATDWQKGDDSKKMLAKLENDLELTVSALLS